MCNRYRLTAKQAEVAATFGIRAPYEIDETFPTGDIFPTGTKTPSHGSSQVKRLCGRACSLFPSAQSYLFYLAGSAASRSNEPKQRACNSA